MKKGPARAVDKNQCTRRERTLELIGEVSGKRILDVGCGYGFISGALTKTNKVYGLDISSKLLKFSSKLGLVTKKWDIRKGLPFKSNFFNIILANEILEHVFDTDTLLSEIKRVLKKDGTLIVSVPNVCSLTSRVQVVLGRLPSYIEYRKDKPGHRAGHIRGYNLSAIKNQLLEHKFKIDDIKTNAINFWRFFVPWRWRFLRSFGEILIIKAKKPLS